MSLLRFTILIIFVVVTSQNRDENSQIPYGEKPMQKSVEATTAFPPGPTVENEGMWLLLTRLETLCEQKLEYLITETNGRFQSLEYQSSEVHSTVDYMRDELGRMSQCSAIPATPVDQNNEKLEAKVENLVKNIQKLINATKSLHSDVEAIKRNVSSLINITRASVDLSSNLKLKQIFNEGLQELKKLQTSTSTSCPLNLTVVKPYPRNCREVQESPKTVSGTFMIQPQYAPKPFEAVCDVETRGGGWTVIQKRFDGSQNFYLDWQHYKNGFGNLGGEFWLGLENIHFLTGFDVIELLIEIGDFESQNKSAFYSQFSVGSEVEGYSLKVLGAYSGDAGDSLTYHAKRKFTTIDKDQDDYGTNCAQYCSGAWWYGACAHSNLNGKYFDRDRQVPEIISPEAVFWNTFKGLTRLKHTRMLVRPAA